MPAAASRWPTFVFTDCTSSGRSGDRPAPNTARRARTSIGSPSVVPVPWHSTKETASGSSRGVGERARITASWAAAFGAVRPLLRPSWLTLVPRMTAEDPVAGGHGVATGA